MTVKLAKTLQLGDEVRYKDPDNDITSGVYLIVNLHGGITDKYSVVSLTNWQGSEIDAYVYELS